MSLELWKWSEWIQLSAHCILPGGPGGPRGPWLPTPGLPRSPFSPASPGKPLHSELHLISHHLESLWNIDYSSAGKKLCTSVQVLKAIGRFIREISSHCLIPCETVREEIISMFPAQINRLWAPRMDPVTLWNGLNTQTGIYVSV